MINPSRLELARRRRGWTKSRLAAELGVSVRSVSAYESGSQQPSPGTLERIVESLGFPEAFFAAPDVEVVAPEAASFRAMARMTASQRDQALGAGTLALMLDDWIESNFRRPAPSLPRLDDSDPETAAEVVRAEWGLGTRPVKNMVHLLERQGVRVFSLDEHGREVDAFSFWRSERPYVLLNTMKSAEHSRFDAAHELGHLVMHPDGTHGRDAEHEANQFASAFLMPRSSLLAAGLHRATLSTIVRRKREWRVSAVALVFRLHTLGVLTDWQYRSLFVQASKKGYRTNEPNPVEHERSQVFDKVFAHTRAHGMSRRELADAVGLNVDDIDRLLFGLVLLPTSGDSSTGRQPAARDHLRLVE